MIVFGILVLLALGAFVLAARGGLSSVARGRKYKSGTSSCFWRWSDVESEYILRLHIVKTPWFAVCLHWIRKPDAEPWLHDHPVSFLAIVLRGRYAELRASGDGDIRHRVHRWWNVIRARKTDRHRIVFCRANTLTLCFMGPKVREWGFHMPKGWVGWKDYYARLKPGENVRCTTGWIPAFERECKPVLDAMTAHFEGSYAGKIFVDEEARRISNVEGDFDDEAPTEPRK